MVHSAYLYPFSSTLDKKQQNMFVLLLSKHNDMIMYVAIRRGPNNVTPCIPLSTVDKDKSINISSCECNKVVTDILAKLSFLLILKTQITTHNLSYSGSLKSK